MQDFSYAHTFEHYQSMLGQYVVRQLRFIRSTVPKPRTSTRKPWVNRCKRFTVAGTNRVFARYANLNAASGFAKERKKEMLPDQQAQRELTNLRKVRRKSTQSLDFTFDLSRGLCQSAVNSRRVRSSQRVGCMGDP
jgi:hypothetical protein